MSTMKSDAQGVVKDITEEARQRLMFEAGTLMGFNAVGAALLVINARIELIAKHLALDVDKASMDDDTKAKLEELMADMAQQLETIAELSKEGDPAEFDTATTAEQDFDKVAAAVDEDLTQIDADTVAKLAAADIAQIMQREAKLKAEREPFATTTERCNALIEALVEARDNANSTEAKSFLNGLLGEAYQELEDAEGATPNIFALPEGEIIATPVPLENDAAHAATMGAVPPEAITGSEAPVWPKFTTTRTKPRSGHITEQGTLMVYVFGTFDDVDFSNEDQVKSTYDSVMKYHRDTADAASISGIISEDMATRLKQEYNFVDIEDVIADVEMPSPGDITDIITGAAGNGDTHIDVTVTSELEVAEALMAAFSVSAVRFDLKANSVMLASRLAALGMS